MSNEDPIIDPEEPTAPEVPSGPPFELPYNSRFVPLGGGLMAEYVADNVNLNYEPTTQATRATFHGKLYIKPQDKYLSVAHPDGRGEDILSVDLTDKGSKRVIPEHLTINDPVTGVNLGQVSIEGLKILHKFSYDTFHNEEALRMAQETWLAAESERQMNEDHQRRVAEEEAARLAFEEAEAARIAAEAAQENQQ